MPATYPNAINIQETIIGKANNCNTFFLPKQFARYPVGMAPKHAPRVIREPTHDPSSSEMYVSSIPPCSMGIAEDVQERQDPIAKALNVAVKILLIRSFCFKTNTYLEKQLGIVKKFCSRRLDWRRP